MAEAKWDGRRWRLRTTLNGKTRSFSSSVPGRKGKAEVEEKARKYGRLTDVCTFAEAWDRYLEQLHYLTGPENWRNVESIGRNYLLPKLGPEKLIRLQIFDYQSTIFAARKQDGTELAKKSLMNIRGVIINFTKFCKNAGLLDATVTDLHVPRSAKKIGKQILQPEDARRLFDEFGGEWYVNLFRFMLATGCRPGEAHALKWSDIKDGMIHIQRSINYRGRETGGKNENANRSFSLNSILEKILDDQKTKTWRLNSEFVFCNHAGNAPRQTDTIHTWNRIRKEMGVDVSPYGLRHTFVSYMAQTLPEMSLKAIIGHASSMDTYGVYGHAVNGQSQEDMKQVNISLLSRIEKS